MSNNEYRARISIDAAQANGSLSDTTRAVGGASSIFNSFGSLLRGDFAGALMQARAGFVALRVAMMSNPIAAIATAVLSLGVALAGLAWRKHKEEAEAYAKAIDELKASTENYKKTVSDLAFRGADTRGKRDIIKSQVDTLDYEVYRTEQRKTRSPSEEAQKQADVTSLKTELAKKQFELNQLNRQLSEEREKEDLENQKAAKDQKLKLQDLDAQRSALEKELEKNRPGYGNKERIADLQKEINDLIKQEASYVFDVEAKKKDGIEILRKKIELQQLLNAEAEQEAIKKENAAAESAKAAEAEARRNDRKKAEKPAKVDEPEKRNPLDGVDSFIQQMAGQLGGSRMAMSPNAVGFREKLNPSAIQTLGIGFNKTGSTSPWEVGNSRDALAERSAKYLEMIAINTTRTGAGE